VPNGGIRLIEMGENKKRKAGWKMASERSGNANYIYGNWFLINIY